MQRFLTANKVIKNCHNASNVSKTQNKFYFYGLYNTICKNVIFALKPTWKAQKGG